MIFGFVTRSKLDRVLLSRLRAKSRLRETYDREKRLAETSAGDSRFEESSFRGEVIPQSKPSWAHYFLDDRFSLSRPEPEELAPIRAEFTYQPVPGVEITIISPDEAWDLWDKAYAELHQNVDGVESGSSSTKGDPA